MLRKYTLTFAILFSSYHVSLFAQAKYDKYLVKAEGYYKTGDYIKSSSTLTKLKKKTKKLGSVNAYTPKYHLLLAKNNLAAGLLIDFESNLNQAIVTTAELNKESSLEYGMVHLDGAKLHNQNGTYRIARDLLSKGKKIIDSGSFMTETIQANYDIILAETLSGQGYFNEALDILRNREIYFLGRAVKQESFMDDKGGLKSRKLSKEEIEVRFNEYANMLTLFGLTYGNQGNLKSADSAFVLGTNWIDKNLGRNDLAYIKNQFNHAMMLKENGNETLPKELELDRTLNSIKIDHKSSHYLAIEIFEAYLEELMNSPNSARYANSKLEFEKIVNKSFGAASIYHVQLKAIEFDSKRSKDRMRNLENDANNLLVNAKGLTRNNLTTTRVLEFLYTLAIQEKKYSNAEKYLTDIIDIKSELFGKDAPQSHLAQLRLANFYLDYTNKLTEADKIYQKSYVEIVSKEIRAWHKDHLDILNHLATSYELTDKYQKAIETLDKAVYVARSKFSDTDYQYGSELTEIARLEIKLGSYDNAEKHLVQSLKILEEFRKEEDKKVHLINAIETEAVLFGIKGMFDDAQDALDRAAKIIRRAEDLVGFDELTTAKEMSSLFIQLGKYSATELLLEELIKEYQKLYGENSRRLITPLVNQGKLTLAKGDYTQAEKIALRANQIAVSTYGESSTKVAPVQKLLSDIYYTIGDNDKAETFIRSALTSQEKQFGRSHIEVANSLAQLAIIKFYKGDNKKEVEKIILEARDIMGTKLGTDNPQYAEILKNVAILYISEKRYDIAFSSLTQAEAIWKAKAGSKNNINTASIYTLTGDVYYEQKNYKQADEFYKKSKNLYEKFFSRNHPEYVRVLSKMAKVQYMEKDFKKAKSSIEEALANYDVFIKQYFPALSEREKAKYWNTIKIDFEFYNTLAFGSLEDFRDLSGKIYDYQLLTKALLLSSSIKIRERIMNSKDENLIYNYNLWQQKKEFLTNALSMSTQQQTENGIDASALSHEVEKLEKDLSEKSELFSQDFENKKITYKDVQGSLGPNDVAVEMVRFRYFNHTFTDSIIYVALYVKNDKARPKVIELAEGHRMESRFFHYYRNCIIGKIEDQFSYGVFWEPIAKEIGQYSTIFLSPDGVYNQLNLEAIPTPDGKYVIDNSNIVIVSNTKDLYLRKIKAKTANSSKTATMFGNPTFYMTASTDKSIPSLPGTEKEINQLDQLLKKSGWTTKEYVETLASEERVKELESPRIFHIATHGFYTQSSEETEELAENEAQMSSNPLLKTGLLLKGAGDLLNKTKYNYNMESGILTAYEAMNLNLDQTDLVVLSACETGLGEISNGEGVYGLQRAFLVAGAKSLIMSMFKVDDAATQELIINFYNKWLTSGKLRQSFIDAKKELRMEYPEPIYWGSFMMIGLD